MKLLCVKHWKEEEKYSYREKKEGKLKKPTMKDIPITERPYEKLINYGENSLSNAELLAIVLKTGTKNETSVEIAQKILMLDEKCNLSNISKLEIAELTKIKGIGLVKAIQIKAVVELAKRIARPSNIVNTRINTSQDVYELLKYECINENKEKLFVINLSVKNDVIKISTLATGGQTQISAKINEIFYETVKLQAGNIIIVHNHPSGDTKPSKADITFTYKIIEASKLLNINLLDHIIISNIGFTSLKEQGII